MLPKRRGPRQEHDSYNPGHRAQAVVNRLDKVVVDKDQKRCTGFGWAVGRGGPPFCQRLATMQGSSAGNIRFRTPVLTLQRAARSVWSSLHPDITVGKQDVSDIRPGAMRRGTDGQALQLLA